jgi:DNA (cytosine-5)-methyltransferase 1
MWMTPTARDHKDGATSLANTPVNGLLGRQVLTTPTAGSDISVQRRTLNPAFVEALMGWPSGWTGFGSVATEWSRWLRRMRSELSLLSCWPTDDDTIAGAGHGA